MQVRLVAVLLLSSCFPGTQLRERVELAPREVIRDDDTADHSCWGVACYDLAAQLSDLHVRNVGIETAKPEQPSVEVKVALPVTVTDCSMVGLTIVGPWQAMVGDSIVLNVLVRGLEENAIGEPASVSWETDAGELTELGPLTGEIQCSVPGMHIVSAELAPPSPCPSQLDLAINCQAPVSE